MSRDSMGTEERTLELNVISAKDLKKVRKFGPDVCYAVAYIRARDKKSTAVDKEGGNNPKWNSKLVFTCDESLLQRGAGCITVEIYSYGSFSNKLVGTSKISLLDIGKLVNQTRPPSSMSFEVRRPSGKARGTLTVYVKLGEKRSMRNSAQVPYVTTASSTYSPMAGRQDASNASGSVYPPQKTSSGSAVRYEAGKVPSAAQVYPPPIPSSGSSYGSNASSAGQVYPPPKTSGGSNVHSSKVEQPAMAYPPRVSGGNNGHSSKVEDPVMAYPAQGYGAYQFPANKYGSQYPDAQQYYPPPQGNVPYNYQQAYYSKPQRPPKRQSKMGMGLLGGALGGLLLGDMVGDMGGF